LNLDDAVAVVSPGADNAINTGQDQHGEGKAVKHTPAAPINLHQIAQRNIGSCGRDFRYGLIHAW
jgi:hypothetical protein